jgi:RNA polymerase sigma factor (sigma-70 family)
MDDASEFIPTRHSLLSRLKDWDDHEGWKLFFDTYWKLIHNAAIKAGLSDAEAQDVVQETLLSVLKKMPGFEYEPEKGSFKKWLMRLTRWRITDQLRKRQRGIEDLAREGETDNGIAAIDCRAESVMPGVEALWEAEWEKKLMEAALDRVKRKVDPKQYQAFDLYVFKRWPVSKVARTLRINPGRVYLAKHRINKLIIKELARLHTQPL